MSKRSTRCKKCSGQEAYRNHNWRGGKIKHAKGYVLVLCPEHPTCAESHTSYVMQHRLVMEETLGRYLNPNETVHHKNGIRDDNRPENLELWASIHPSGQRVTDLVEWAKQVLTMYG